MRESSSKSSGFSGKGARLAIVSSLSMRVVMMSGVRVGDEVKRKVKLYKIGLEKLQTFAINQHRTSSFYDIHLFP